MVFKIAEVVLRSFKESDIVMLVLVLDSIVAMEGFFSSLVSWTTKCPPSLPIIGTIGSLS